MTPEEQKLKDEIIRKVKESGVKVPTNPDEANELSWKMLIHDCCHGEDNCCIEYEDNL